MISSFAKSTGLALLAAAMATACGESPPPTDPSAASTPGTPPAASAPANPPSPAAAAPAVSAPSAAPAAGACVAAGGHCVNVTAMVACKGKPPAACGANEYCCVM